MKKKFPGVGLLLQNTFSVHIQIIIFEVTYFDTTNCYCHLWAVSNQDVWNLSYQANFIKPATEAQKTNKQDKKTKKTKTNKQNQQQTNKTKTKSKTNNNHMQNGINRPIKKVKSRVITK